LANSGSILMPEGRQTHRNQTQCFLVPVLAPNIDTLRNSRLRIFSPPHCPWPCCSHKKSESFSGQNCYSMLNAVKRRKTKGVRGK